jgi:hypothetical protein
MATQKRAQPLPGNKLYQIRAKQALPLLVRQAQTQTEITYGDLAQELGMRARNLNFVLGCIGRSLIALAEKWNETIPPIQTIVVNKHTGLPGKGGKWFAAGDQFETFDSKKLDLVIKRTHQDVFLYPKWNVVLRHFGLAPAHPIQALAAAAFSGGGGESQRHKDLKNAIAKDSSLVGLSFRAGRTEYPLPSGDFLDVCFETTDELAAVEVKTRISNEADLVRGFFQCVKYQAVMTSDLSYKGLQKRASVLLAIETALPASLIPLRNALGVKVVELIPVLADEVLRPADRRNALADEF